MTEGMHARKMSARFDTFDRDGDGEISFEEWGRLLRAMGAHDASVQRRLKAIDADGDGRLNVRDLLSTAQAYYTTDDDMPDFEEV